MSQMKSSFRPAKFLFGIIAVLVIAAPFLWMLGGLQWLDKKVFPAKRPKFMPVNSVWIDAPPLPISWHHGWWFGCGMSAARTANYCRLEMADGQQVYAGEYLPCSGASPLEEADLRLKPPPYSVDMWLFKENNDGVIGFLKNGDLLLPVQVREKCGEVKARLQPAPQ